MTDDQYLGPLWVLLGLIWFFGLLYLLFEITNADIEV